MLNFQAWIFFLISNTSQLIGIDYYCLLPDWFLWIDSAGNICYLYSLRN